MSLVILDRDGTINQDSADFIKSAEEWRPLPGSLEAIAALTAAGFQVVIFTNQSGLARSLFDEAGLAAIHARMEEAVEAAGGRLAGIYYCPHGPDEGCDCRKPQPGLLRQIARDWGMDLEGVPVVGDSRRDVEAAASVGARPMLVLTGNGEAARAGRLPAGTEIFSDLAAVARQLIKERTA